MRPHGRACGKDACFAYVATQAAATLASFDGVSREKHLRFALFSLCLNTCPPIRFRDIRRIRSDCVVRSWGQGLSWPPPHVVPFARWPKEMIHRRTYWRQLAGWFLSVRLCGSFAGRSVLRAGQEVGRQAVAFLATSRRIGRAASGEEDTVVGGSFDRAIEMS